MEVFSNSSSWRKYAWSLCICSLLVLTFSTSKANGITNDNEEYQVHTNKEHSILSKVSNFNHESAILRDSLLVLLGTEISRPSIPDQIAILHNPYQKILPTPTLQNNNISISELEPHELSEKDLAKFKVLVISSDISRKYQDIFDNNNGLLLRFVSSGHVLVVLGQKETSYQWMSWTPLSFKEKFYNTNASIDNHLKKITNHELTSDLSLTDFRAMSTAYPTGDFAGNITTIIQEDNPPHRPLLWYAKIGSGLVVFSAFQPDKYQDTESSRILYQNLLKWSLGQANPEPGITPLSKEGFSRYIYTNLVTTILVAYGIFSIYYMTRRKFVIPSFVSLLKDSRVFLVALFIFALGDIFPFKFLIMLLLLAVFFYEFNLFRFVGIKTSTKRQRIILVTITMAWSLLTYFGIFWILSGNFTYKSDNIGNFTAWIEYLLIFFVSAPLISILTLSIKKYIFVDNKEIIEKDNSHLSPDNNHQNGNNEYNNTSNIESRSVHVQKDRHRQYAIGCYLLVTSFISNTILIGLFPDQRITTPFSSENVPIILTFVFLFWQFTGILTKKDVKGHLEVLANISQLFLTRRGLLYFFIWVVLFIMVSDHVESMLVFLLAETTAGFFDIYATMGLIAFSFYILIFPSYLIYLFAKRHESEHGNIQDKIRIVFPLTNFVFLSSLLYTYANPSKISTYEAYLLTLASLVNIAVWLSIHIISWRKKLHSASIAITPKMETRLLAVLLITYGIGYLGGLWTFDKMVRYDEILHADLQLLAILSLSITGFFFAYKWYFKNTYKWLRVTFSIASIVVGSLIAVSYWWLGFIFLTSILTSQDIFIGLIQRKKTITKFS